MRHHARLLHYLLLAVFVSGLVACAGNTPSPPPFDEEEEARSGYPIGVTDVLLVSVYGNPELTVEVPVRPDGMISVPLIDDVRAAGLTPTQLKKVVTAALSEYVELPSVTIIVREMNSRFVSVIGEVEREDRIPLTQNLRILEAIALAGGFTIYANKSDIRIVRWTDGQEVEYKFNYNAYKRGRAPNTNFVLRPGDTIIVPD